MTGISSDPNFSSGGNEGFSWEDLQDEQRHPGYLELLTGFRTHCERQYSATIDVEPDDEPRSQIIERMVRNTSPKNKDTSDHATFSGLLSDGRTDMNGWPFAMMVYTTENAGNRSVVPVSAITFFLPLGADQLNSHQSLEIIKGKAALMAVFEDEHSRLPQVFALMDNEAFSNSLESVEKAAHSVAKRRDGGSPFAMQYEAPSTLVGLMLQRVHSDNDKRAIEELLDAAGSDQLPDDRKPVHSRDVLIFGIHHLTPPDGRLICQISVIIASFEQALPGAFITPNPNDWKRQDHTLRLLRDADTGMVSVEPARPFVESLFSLN